MISANAVESVANAVKVQVRAKKKKKKKRRILKSMTRLMRRKATLRMKKTKEMIVCVRSVRGESVVVRRGKRSASIAVIGRVDALVRNEF